MSDPTHPFSTVVRITFDPYNYHDVQAFLKAVHKTFGLDRNRWYMKSPNLKELNNRPNIWVLDFYFSNPHDATIFGLKHPR